jgi:hypothetical protein
MSNKSTPKCIALTTKNEPCTRSAKKDNVLCGFHLNQGNKPAGAPGLPLKLQEKKNNEFDLYNKCIKDAYELYQQSTKLNKYKSENVVAAYVLTSKLSELDRFNKALVNEDYLSEIVEKLEKVEIRRVINDVLIVNDVNIGENMKNGFEGSNGNINVKINVIDPK